MPYIPLFMGVDFESWMLQSGKQEEYVHHPKNRSDIFSLTQHLFYFCVLIQYD